TKDVCRGRNVHSDGYRPAFVGGKSHGERGVDFFVRTDGFRSGPYWVTRFPRRIGSGRDRRLVQAESTSREINKPTENSVLVMGDMAFPLLRPFHTISRSFG